MYLIWILSCVFCVLNLVYCEDDFPFFAFIINPHDHSKCKSTSEIYQARVGQQIEVPLLATQRIDDVIIKSQNASKVKQDNSNSKSGFRFDRHKLQFMIMKHDHVDESLQGIWLITIYMLADVQPPTPPVVRRGGHNYTEIICNMNITLTDEVSFMCEDVCIYIWSTFSVLMCIVIILQASFIFYKRHKAGANQKYAQLTASVDKTNENSNGARYCENPIQKPILANDRDSSRESGIYEALETLQIKRRLPIPEPPQLDTLPRAPKPIPMTLLREPLPDPPPIQSSKQRPFRNDIPTSLRKNENKSPVPVVLQEEDTYEPPPNYHPPPSNGNNASPEEKTKKPKSSIFRVRMPTLTKKLKVEENFVEKDRSSFERIKERPPMPIPNLLQETEEVYEEMASSSAVSLLPNAESKIPTLATSSLVRNTAANKPVTAKKPALPKQPAELKENSATRFIKLKPDTPQKPTKLISDTSDNITDELSSILKKRKETSSGLATPNTASRTPATGSLGMKASPTTVNPIVNSKPTVSIHVEEINNDEHTQSSDDEWTYEPLPNYNIYSI